MGISYHFILVAIIAFTFSALSIPQIVSLAHAKKLYDTPNARKATQKIIPTLGGAAIFIGLTLGVTLGGNGYPFFNLKFIFASLLVCFFAGLKDDLVGISPYSKLLALTFSLIIIAFFANLRITSLYGLFGIEQLGFVPSIILTFFLGIVIINAMNLIDGIDGLAVAIAIEISFLLGIWFALIGLPEYALLAFSLFGSCLAFFIFNVFGNKNKIFMGDTGSLILGTMLFVLAVKFNEYNATYTGPYSINSVPAVIFGFLAYPLIDVLRVVILRVFILKRSPFVADKNHIHHRLLALGFTHLQATIIVIVFNSICIVGALLLQRHLDVFTIGIIILSFGLLLCTILEFYVYKKRLISPDDETQRLMIPTLFLKKEIY
jgi:UDP-GlcNAc:undecaprenyl-phosphate/decaprenyl-phosphate GlcNAc-1-phosphate transferase